MRINPLVLLSSTANPSQASKTILSH